MKASIGEVVHYIQPGAEDGSQETACLAAIVTETPGPKVVNLVTFSPKGEAQPQHEVMGDRGSEGADTWHPAANCPHGR